MHSPMHNPVHPGMLVREYLGDRSIVSVAKHIGVAPGNFIPHCEWQFSDHRGYVDSFV